ncbi:MAG: hypothetical protein WBD02_03735 [Acidimicrobiia bacterium]
MRRSLMALGVPAVALAIAVSACGPPVYDANQNAAMEANAANIVAQMGAGTIHYRGTSEFECPAPEIDNRNHWGAVTAEFASTPAWRLYSLDICVSGGLSRSNSHRGTVSLHEAGHVWARRIDEIFESNGNAPMDWSPIGGEEAAMDCFAESYSGNPAFTNYRSEPCTPAEIDFVNGVKIYFPPGDGSWRYYG